MKKPLYVLLICILLAACAVAEGGNVNVTTGVLVDAAMHTLLLECVDGERYYFSKDGDVDTSGLSDGLTLGKVIEVTHNSSGKALAIADGTMGNEISIAQYTEGEKESVRLTYFVSGLNYATYYNAELFEHVIGENGADIFTPTTGLENARLCVEAFPNGDFEGIFTDVVNTMNERGLSVTELTASMFGEEVTGAFGVKGADCEIAFAAQMGKNAYLARVYCPYEALEGIGVRMLEMLQSMTATDENGMTMAYVYMPDADYNLLIASEARVSLTPQGLVNALYDVGAFNTPVAVVNCEIDGISMSIDMSRGFGDMLKSTGTAGEFVIMGSLVNTLIINYGIENVYVTCMGEIIETGHSIYDFALSYFE